jgi:hypothetical protein
MRNLASKLAIGAIALPGLLAPSGGWASSHREAPFITKMPKVDGTDLYVFDSYERSRTGYVTLLANYQPVQEPAGGPNFYMFDPAALYEIHIDNDGDAVEDLTFQFQFSNTLRNGTGIKLDVGPDGNKKKIAVPFIAVAPVSAGNEAGRNVFETYKLTLVRGARRGGHRAAITEAGDRKTPFGKPLDNIGTKTIPDYPAYARSFIYDIDIPGCTPPPGTRARVFVGQRREGFAINLGAIFDLLNFTVSGRSDVGRRNDDKGQTDSVANILGPQFQGYNYLVDKNVSTLALEVPVACLARDPRRPVIGVWTTASVRQARVINPEPTFDMPSKEVGPWAQVSRLGMPLVNEVVIGLKDKDRFNSSEPRRDAQFADYVTNPTLPEIVELLFGGAGVVAPNRFPRTDLVQVFLTGIPGVNANGSTAEMMRLNTAVRPTPRNDQNWLGAAQCFNPPTATMDAVLNLTRPGCDPAGFPNGRRPGDDVVDIELRVAMGFLLNTTDAPSGQLPFVDGAGLNACVFDAAFPYLTTPLPGAPNRKGDLQPVGGQCGG